MNNMKNRSALKKNLLIIGLVMLLSSSFGLMVWARYVDANNSMKRTIVSLADALQGMWMRTIP